VQVSEEKMAEKAIARSLENMLEEEFCIKELVSKVETAVSQFKQKIAAAQQVT